MKECLDSVKSFSTCSDSDILDEYMVKDTSITVIYICFMMVKYSVYKLIDCRFESTVFEMISQYNFKVDIDIGEYH